MNDNVYDALMKMCYELEDTAMSYLSDVDLYDIYNDRILNDNMIYGVLLQLSTISKIKNKIRRVRIKNKKLYDAIVKEGEAE